MIRHPLLAALLVVIGTVASGTLECGPVERTDAQLHGAEIYGRMCAVCHGAVGEGYKADQATALAHPDFLATVSDDYLRYAIANGRSGTTMSAWANERGGPLARGDVEAVVAFVRTWDRRPRAKLDETPMKGNAPRGADTYGRECAKCHGARGTGGPNVSIGNADLLSRASNGFLRAAINGGRPGTSMPSFDAKLDDVAIDDTIAFVRSFAAPPPRPPPTRSPPIPLGPVPLNPKGPEPIGFHATPGLTSVETVKAQLIDRHAKMAILDARAPSDYANEHIAGAVSVPFYEPDPYIASLPRDAWLVCYCACPHAESGQLAQKLVAKGFTKVTVLDEGLPVWKNKHYPTATGLDP